MTAPTWTPGATLSDYNTDDGKANLISNYAPRVWLATKDGELEPYKPSSVDWAFERFDRYKNEDGRYWLAAKDKYELNNSPDTYEFFRGNFTTCPPPPVYSFLVERGNGYVDVIYYMFYPFNRGKSISILGSDGTYYGNHVGDWEHITVRFKKEANGYYPFEVYVSAHDFGGAYAWSEMNKVLVSGTLTHPIVYAAWGSHGLWKDSGNHNYKSINYGVGSVDLTDICNDGQAWDTWYNTVRLYYNEKRGIEGSVSASCGTMDSSTWPAWMSTDFTNPGTGDPTVPGNGPIYRWGDTESGCQDILGQCRIENGPTGPSAKDVWFTETASTSTINPAPAAASWGSGRLDIFVKGSNGDLSHKGYDGGWWSGWESLGGVLTTAPAVTSWAWGRLDIFVRATDGNLYQKIFDNGWSDWINLGNPGTLGTIDSAPAVASWGSGRLDIFVKGSNGDLLHKGYDGGYDGWWSGWESQGGVLTSAPAVASWGYGRLDVFVKGTDNILYQKYYDGGWSGWIGQ